MRLLRFPVTTFLVRRTGLPFYDAERVIGVAHLFFGTSGATVRETSYGWLIEGVTDLNNVADACNRVLASGVRLERGFDARKLNYGRLLEWHEKMQKPESWPALIDYFSVKIAADDTNKKRKNPTSSASMELEVGLGQGLRGYDPSKYGDFASSSGSPSEQPEEEIFVALIGLSHAARVNNDMYLLPIFGSITDEADKEYPVTTASYWNYNLTFTHESGESIAATWAMISLTRRLFSKGMAIQDFAYNYARSRGPYHSGTRGAESLSRLWRKDCENILRQTEDYLQDSRGEKGVGADLARALSSFVLRQTPENLERVARLKVRALLGEASLARAARKLFREPETMKEIRKVLKIPELPSGLCETIGQALALPKEDGDATETPPKEWISRYLKLENAGDAGRFFAEVERLLARSPTSKGKIMFTVLSGSTQAGDKPLDTLINELSSPRVFRAWRAAFLLSVLQRMAVRATRINKIKNEARDTSMGAEPLEDN